MANTKNATVREIIIDRCLSDRHGRYSVRDLMAACNRRLEEEKMELVTSTTTIRLDLNNMETHYGVHIVSDKVWAEHLLPLHPSAAQRRHLPRTEGAGAARE